MFRFKKSIPVDYDTQGYIHFLSLRYKKLTEREQRRIRSLCRSAAGSEYYPALLEFVTTGADPVAVCGKYFISQSTLERIVRKYYIRFAQSL